MKRYYIYDCDDNIFPYFGINGWCIIAQEKIKPFESYKKAHNALEMILHGVGRNRKHYKIVSEDELIILLL
jgi:hypothetical protein